MNKLMLLVFAAAAYYGARQMEWVSPSFELQGPPGPGQVLVADAAGKATFTVLGPAEQTYMLFGGTASSNADSHAMVFGLELDEVRRIARRHPDFYMCNSPGASEAQGLLKSVEMVADRRTVSKVKDGLKEHEKRLGGGDRRLCATLRGQWLALEKLEMWGQVHTPEDFPKMLPGYGGRRVNVHVQSVEVSDCAEWK